MAEAEHGEDLRGGRGASSLGLVATALVPGALTAYFAFNDGGFFTGSVSLVAAELALALAAWFALARRPLAGLGGFSLTAVVALGAFAAWTLASSEWSDSPARATPEYVRALLYGLVLLLFAALPYSLKRVRWMLYGLVAAIVATCVVALIARTMPDVIYTATTVHPERLSHPLGYWNSLGILAAIGIVLCGHLACSTRDHWAWRVVGAAAVPLLATTLYYTFSRGSTWAALGAVALYVVVGRPRALLSGALATGPATLYALTAANPANALTGPDPLSPAALAAGDEVATALAASVIAAAVIRGALLPLDAWLDGLRLGDRARRPVLASLAVVGAAGLLAGCAALNVPSVVETKYAEFTADDDRVSSYAGSSRLLSAGSNGRREHWDVALAAYRSDPLQGSGAGMYDVDWSQRRDGSVSVRDAHSLYLEVLGELGLPGLVALALALLLIVGAFAYRARGPNRALYAALLAAGLGWAVHAGIDWDWEMPVVTLWLFAFGGAALARTRDGSGVPTKGNAAIRLGAMVVFLALAVLPATLAMSESRLTTAIAAFKGGDCGTARAEARRALLAMEQRPTPYQLIAFCDMRERRYRSALAAVRSALERDPHNWELHYGVAAARAAVGMDPRGAVRRAARSNPNESLVQSARVDFRGTSKQRWRRAGRSAPLLPPVQGDP